MKYNNRSLREALILFFLLEQGSLTRKELEVKAQMTKSTFHWTFENIRASGYLYYKPGGLVRLKKPAQARKKVSAAFASALMGAKEAVEQARSVLTPLEVLAQSLQTSATGSRGT